jgi:hypothetical protein
MDISSEGSLLDAGCVLDWELDEDEKRMCMADLPAFPSLLSAFLKNNIPATQH